MKRTFEVAFLSILLIQLAGCSSLFFYPNNNIYSQPEQINPNYESLFIQSGTHSSVHAWWLPATTHPPKGTIWFFHGNAQNITSHVINLAWINLRGFNLFIFDYQGYGKSSGTPSFENAQTDALACFRWLNIKSPSNDLPLFIVGQSLGGAIALEFLASNPQSLEQLSGLVIDSTFTEYQAIVKDILGGFWLTWPLQHPLSLLVEGSVNPIDSIKFTEGLPKLLIHSERDSIIPYHHGLRLFKQAPSPKQHLQTNTRHIGTFDRLKNREVLIKFLEDNQ